MNLLPKMYWTRQKHLVLGPERLPQSQMIGNLKGDSSDKAQAAWEQAGQGINSAIAPLEQYGHNGSMEFHISPWPPLGVFCWLLLLPPPPTPHNPLEILSGASDSLNLCCQTCKSPY